MSSERKPVGLATHLTAGGIAGAMEAVGAFCSPLDISDLTAAYIALLAMLSTSRYD